MKLSEALLDKTIISVNSDFLNLLVIGLSDGSFVRVWADTVKPFVYQDAHENDLESDRQIRLSRNGT